MNDELEAYKAALKHIIEQSNISMNFVIDNRADRARYLEAELVRHNIIARTAIDRFAPQLEET